MKPIELISLDDLYQEFADLDQLEACEYLEELGRELPEFPAEFMVDDRLVPGCQSRVWLVTRMSQVQPGEVEILADSDALVVKGLVYIVLSMFSSMTPRQIVECDFEQIFDRFGLGRLILPQRKNGLYSMVRQIRNFAAEEAGGNFAVTSTGGTAPSRDSSVTDPPPVASRSIESVRADFPILNNPLPSGRSVVYLDSASSAQKPRDVIEKQRAVEEGYYANAFRGRYYFGSRVDDEIELTRDKVRLLLGAESREEIVFTSGTTMSINMVARGWGHRFVEPGDEILLNEMEHHANLVPWQNLAKERGAHLRFIPLTSDGRLDLTDLASLMTPKTKLVAVCSMSNVLGTVNPIDVITTRARETGTLVMVDAAQSIPHLPINVTNPDIDFLAFSGHKLYGPSGIGILYARRALLDEMDPFLFGGHMIERVERESSTWAEPPAKFEAGTPAIAQAIGLGAAIDYVTSVGFDVLHAHESKLLAMAHEQLLQIPGLRIFGPDIHQKGGIVSFSIDGLSSEDLAWRLDRAGIFTRHGHHCTMPLHARLGVAATTRASFGMYNTSADVAALVEAIREACSDCGLPS